MSTMMKGNFSKVDEGYNPPADRNARRAYNKAYNAKLRGASQPVSHTKLDDDDAGSDFAKKTSKAFKKSVGS